MVVTKKQEEIIKYSNRSGYSMVGKSEISNRSTVREYGNKGVLMTKVCDKNIHFRSIRKDGYYVDYNYPRQIFSMFYLAITNNIISDKDTVGMIAGSVRANQEVELW